MFSIPETISMPKSGTNGAYKVHNQTLMARSSFGVGTYYDKGLFDAREIGYIY
jgi:hypothetical protein